MSLYIGRENNLQNDEVRSPEVPIDECGDLASRVLCLLADV